MVSSETPVQEVSSFDHLVTQWMSTVTFSLGRRLNSSQVQRRGSSTSPSMEKVHCARSARGVGPAESTGKPSTRYCPGGSRELAAGSRRLPLKPREMNATDWQARLARRRLTPTITTTMTGTSHQAATPREIRMD